MNLISRVVDDHLGPFSCRIFPHATEKLGDFVRVSTVSFPVWQAAIGRFFCSPSSELLTLSGGIRKHPPSPSASQMPVLTGRKKEGSQFPTRCDTSRTRRMYASAHSAITTSPPRMTPPRRPHWPRPPWPNFHAGRRPWDDAGP